MDISMLLTAAGLAVSAIVWLVRLEGRINTNDSRLTASEKRVDGLEERIVTQLDRIEQRLFQLTVAKSVDRG